MKYITEETSDANLSQAMGTFLANANTNKTVLGLSTSDLTDLSKSFGDFNTSLSAATSAKAAQKSAVQDKTSKKAVARAVIARWAQTWRANPAIPDAILDAMMVPNHQNQGTKTPPTQPTDLTLKVNSVGLITLSWKRNGNTTSTVFLIETASAANGPWEALDVTTKAKIDYQGTPGEAIWFRVWAKRDGKTSPVSLPISLWSNGSSLAIAA